jgi:hypothetical protein
MLHCAADALVAEAAVRRRAIAARVKPREGDLLWVPLAEDKGAVGLVLHVSRRYRGYLLIGFFGVVFSRPEVVDKDRLRDWPARVRPGSNGIRSPVLPWPATYSEPASSRASH